MLVITGERQSGKTTALLRLCQADPLGIVVEPTDLAAVHACDVARRLGFSCMIVFGPFSTIEARFAKRWPNYYVDEIGRFEPISDDIRKRIVVATATAELEKNG